MSFAASRPTGRRQMTSQGCGALFQTEPRSIESSRRSKTPNAPLSAADASCCQEQAAPPKTQRSRVLAARKVAVGPSSPRPKRPAALGVLRLSSAPLRLSAPRVAWATGRGMLRMGASRSRDVRESGCRHSFHGGRLLPKKRLCRRLNRCGSFSIASAPSGH